MTKLEYLITETNQVVFEIRVSFDWDCRPHRILKRGKACKQVV